MAVLHIILVCYYIIEVRR